MTTTRVGLGQKPLEPIPGTDVEVVRWANPVGVGMCTVVWLPVDRLDSPVASTEVTQTERERAAGYTREGDRLLSLGSAWLTRRLVAMSLEVPPLEAPIVRHCPDCPRPHGRPVVGAPTPDGMRVQVSATHSRGLIGVALSTSAAVGLDAENLQGRGPGAWPTVWRVLGGHPPASDEPGGLDIGPDYRPGAAYAAATAWVRTEAVLKATGHGLAVSSRSVGITGGADPRVTRWPWGDPTGRVSLFDLSPGGRYVAALAVLHGETTDIATPDVQLPAGVRGWSFSVSADSADTRHRSAHASHSSPENGLDHQ